MKNKSNTLNIDVLKLDKKFFGMFTADELNTIIRRAIAFGRYCIVINTEKYFCELSADMGEKLELYIEINNKSKNLSKEQFLKLLKEIKPF